MPEHGGDLLRASREFSIPQQRWLDLSTGINPSGYPVPQVPANEWLRLPWDMESLMRAAGGYYSSETLLPVAGSQAAIQALPRLRSSSRVLLAPLSYSEHAHAWRRHGHAVLIAPISQFPARLAEIDVLVVCNPNNPTGERIEPARLLEWHASLAAQGGWLVVDEAFIDPTPEASLAPRSGAPGLIVLRSLGKFFGLAGARVGFVFSDPALLRALEAELGPWTVSGPARFAACAALNDRAWQERTRAALARSEQRLGSMLAGAGVQSRGTALFQWWRDGRAGELHGLLARQGILTRRFAADAPGSIRFGLPGAEPEWRRLGEALSLFQEK